VIWRCQGILVNGFIRKNTCSGFGNETFSCTRISRNTRKWSEKSVSSVESMYQTHLIPESRYCNKKTVSFLRNRFLFYVLFLRRAFVLFHFGARHAVLAGFLLHASVVSCLSLGRAFCFRFGGCGIQLTCSFRCFKYFRLRNPPEWTNGFSGGITGVPIVNWQHGG
jgi:hypothetical protein